MKTPYLLLVNPYPVYLRKSHTSFTDLYSDKGDRILKLEVGNVSVMIFNITRTVMFSSHS